tara:strand:+ start:298 stop:1041 length:744 start_codon:yes stop_codon:yes gene_type:complete
MLLNKYYNNFYTNGYTIVKNVISKNDAIELLDEIEIIKNKVSKKKQQYFHKTKDGRFNTIHNIQHFIKKGKIINLTKNKRLLSVVKKLLSEKSYMRNLEFFLKPKKTGLASPFHQDNFYWNIINASALNVWVALSKSSKLNGGLCYLKGSQKLGTINHQLSYMKGSSQKIEDNVIKNLNFKKIFPTLNIGDCVIHHPEVIHGSKPNLSNNDRIGVAISYASKKSKIDISGIKRYKKNLKENLKKIYK